MATEIIIITLLVALNGVLAMTETALVAARRARLLQRAEAGDPGARAALVLLQTPSRFLSTIQIGITLVGILAGAYGGVTLAEDLSARLRTVPLLIGYSDPIAIGVVVLGITYLSLVVGELVPKRIALAHAEWLASRAAGTLQTLARVAGPVVHVLTLSTEALVRLLRIRAPAEPPVTAEEITILVKQGMLAGAIEPAEQAMIERVFRLGDRRISLLMSPRSEIVWLDVEDPPDEVRRKVASSPFATLPVAEGSLDRLLGIVHARELLATVLEGRSLDLRRLVRPALIIPEGTPALDALERFRLTRSEIALLIDEYGGVQGLVNLEDFVEAIIGAIAAGAPGGAPGAVPSEDGSWLVDGLLPIDEFKAVFRLQTLPGEEDHDFETVGGFVMASLGHVPAPGEQFEWEGLTLEVVDMDGHRVDKILVTPVPAGTAAPDP